MAAEYVKVTEPLKLVGALAELRLSVRDVACVKSHEPAPASLPSTLDVVEEVSVAEVELNA